MRFSFSSCYVVLFFFYTCRSFLFFYCYTPADPQPCTSDLLHHETSVPLPPTQSEPFQPMNFQFPKTKVGKQNRSFNAKWLRDYPWLHYVVDKDAVLCFLCAKQKSNLNSAKNSYSYSRDSPTGKMRWLNLESTRILIAINWP